MSFKLPAAVAALLLASTASAAHAGVTEVNAALTAMTQYNLITSGDFNAGHDVEGRAFIGGNLTGGSATFYNNPGSFGVNPPASQPGLTVVGSVLAQNQNLNNGAGAAIGGTAVQVLNPNGTQTINAGGAASLQNLNSHTVNQNVAGLQASLTTTRDTMFLNFSELATYLKGLTKTVDYTTPLGNVIDFTVGTPPASGPAVFSLSDTSVLSGRNLNFNIGLTDFVVINVGGTSASLPQGSNFNGDSASLLGANVIWNFYEATTINFSSRFNGSVLAPLANATFSNSPITGTAVFKTFNQGGEVHMANFGGYRFTPPISPPPGVPEPGAWALMILGFGAAGAMVRRRRALTAA